MSHWLLSHEPAVRLGTFFAVFALMASWELFAARRALRRPRRRRWIANLGIAALDSLLVRALFPAAAVGLAMLAQSEGWGILNRTGLPFALAVALSVVLLDLAIYLQHVMFHAVPVLWKLHMVHHADEDVDLTTGIRFHPIEILVSSVFKFAVIAAIGPPPIGVFLFEVLLNATAIFNHANARLPVRLDRWLRWVLVTPDMHRIHHSVELGESNSNFGFNLPWWDRLFGTYLAQPRDGHEHMRIGVGRLQAPPQSLLGLLTLPFITAPGGQSIGGQSLPGAVPRPAIPAPLETDQRESPTH